MGQSGWGPGALLHGCVRGARVSVSDEEGQHGLVMAMEEGCMGTDWGLGGSDRLNGRRGIVGAGHRRKEGILHKMKIYVLCGQSEEKARRTLKTHIVYYKADGLLNNWMHV